MADEEQQTGESQVDNQTPSTTGEGAQSSTGEPTEQAGETSNKLFSFINFHLLIVIFLAPAASTTDAGVVAAEAQSATGKFVLRILRIHFKKD